MRGRVILRIGANALTVEAGHGFASYMRMLRRSLFGALAITAVGACSSSAEDDGPKNSELARSGDIHGVDVWKDGLVLTGSVTIANDAKVEIAPGARITVAEGQSIRVEGTLTARAAGSHAKITSPKWGGIVVGPGGKADLEGVEMENGGIGIATAPGAQESRFTDGAILNSLKPFVVSEGSKLTVSKVKATTPEKTTAAQLSQSDIDGVFIASRLDYEAYSSEGIAVRKQGELDLQDSTMHGVNGQDLVAARGGKHVKIAYTTLIGSHCGIHIEPVDGILPTFEIDHVTSESNLYGITIYGSAAGPNTVTASNFTGTLAWLDFAGDNGAIAFEGVYTNGKEIVVGGPVPKFTKVTVPYPDAKPR